MAHEAWKPLSNDEVDAMPLLQRVRYHEIAGNEAAMRAGPQMKNGVPVAADQMPDAWRRAREKASNHYAEAKRLKRILADHQERMDL